MNKIYGLCFSPAGNTEKIVRTIMEELAEKTGWTSEYLSITTPEDRKFLPEFQQSDFVIAGTPTYAGRVPNKIMPYIRDSVKGQGSPCAVIVTYGNRSYDDALIELGTLMEENGFRVTGGGAFVSEHSFAEKLATGRPDQEDLETARRLGQNIGEKLEKKDYSRPELPGNKDFDAYYVPKGIDGKPAKFLKARPVTDREKCTLCGKCRQVCPMGSISEEENYEVTGICIKCQACIKVCPEHAKFFDDEAFLSHKAMLEKNFAEAEKVSEIYL